MADFIAHIFDIVKLSMDSSLVFVIVPVAFALSTGIVSLIFSLLRRA